MRLWHTRLVVNILLASLILGLLPFGTLPAAAQTICGSPEVSGLTAGQNTSVGTVTISNDQNYLYIIFSTSGGWILSETHVHVATSVADIPTNDNGIPVPGQFSYSSVHNNTTSTTYSIPLADLGDGDLVIAAHATVALVNSAGAVQQMETAWGGSNSGSGARWWFTISYTVQDCGTPPEAPTLRGDGCTPGYWKNHEDSWTETGYPPQLLVGNVYGMAPGALSTITLLDALSLRGGKDTDGAAQILMRASVAALLNASHPDISYPYTAGGVISQTTSALASGDRQTMLNIAGTLDDANNLGCPLSGKNSKAQNSKGKGQDKAAEKGKGSDSGKTNGSTNGKGKGKGKDKSKGKGKGKNPNNN